MPRKSRTVDCWTRWSPLKSVTRGSRPIFLSMGSTCTCMGSSKLMVPASASCIVAAAVYDLVPAVLGANP